MKWEDIAKNLLKSELKKRGMNYEKLQEKLVALGLNESVNGINLKINRGTFQFTFFLQCAAAIGIKTLRLDDLLPDDNE